MNESATMTDIRRKPFVFAFDATLRKTVLLDLNARFVVEWVEKLAKKTPVYIHQYENPQPVENFNRDPTNEAHLHYPTNDLIGHEMIADILPAETDFQHYYFLITESAPTGHGGNRQEYIKKFKNKLTAPSTFGEPATYVKEMADPNSRPATDRPLSAQPDVPNMLLCDIFRQFVDDMDSITPTASAFVSAMEFRTALAGIYMAESDRRDTFNNAMGKYMPDIKRQSLSGVLNLRWEADGWQTLADQLVSIWECKTEIGSKGAEPHWKLMQYYTAATYIVAEKPNQYRAPLFLGAYYGSMVDLSAAIWDNEVPVIQKIPGATISFDWHLQDTWSFTRAARILTAYKVACRRIHEYWDPLRHDLPKPSFPDIHSYMPINGSPSVSFEYIARLQSKLLFPALTTGPERKPIILKFVRRYSLDLHNHCFNNNFAPRLLAYQNIRGGWFMVVMDDLSTTHDILTDENCPSIEQQDEFNSRIQNMNAAGFVHGDLRPPNVLVPKNNGDPLILLDFDWGGQDSVTRYPGNLNIAIQRHDTVRNGGVIEAVHDRFMLDRLFN